MHSVYPCHLPYSDACGIENSVLLGVVGVWVASHFQELHHRYIIQWVGWYIYAAQECHVAFSKWRRRSLCICLGSEWLISVIRSTCTWFAPRPGCQLREMDTTCMWHFLFPPFARVFKDVISSLWQSCGSRVDPAVADCIWHEHLNWKWWHATPFQSGSNHTCSHMHAPTHPHMHTHTHTHTLTHTHTRGTVTQAAAQWAPPSLSWDKLSCSWKISSGKSLQRRYRMAACRQSRGKHCSVSLYKD